MIVLELWTLINLQVCKFQKFTRIYINYLVGGTGSEFFLGCCESFHKDGLKHNELEEVLS